MSERRASQSPRPQRLWVLPTIVTLILIAVLVGIFVGTQLSSQNAHEPEVALETGQERVPEELLEDAIRRDQADPLAIGEANAPVVLVVFSDYQCPFCARWYAETFPELQSFIDEGQLRVEWRDVNIYGEDSRRGALASMAAGQQDQFWDYHSLLFPNGKTLSAQELGEEHLIELAVELGLDATKFTEDLSAPQTDSSVGENELLGRSLGVYSTPAFLMNDIPLVGAQPTKIFVEAFYEALEGAEK